VPGKEGLQQMNYRRSANNPYFELYENPEGFVRNRTIVNLSATYEWKNFNILGRFGKIYYNEDWFEKKAKSSYTNDSGVKNGYYRKGLSNTKETTAEFLATYTLKPFEFITAKYSIGGSHYRRDYNKLQNEIYGLYFTDQYTINNRLQAPRVDDWTEESERNSMYSFLNLEYKSKVYLDITGRNDWSSTLIPKLNSYFYPSVALSALMHDILRLPAQRVSFGSSGEAGQG